VTASGMSGDRVEIDKPSVPVSSVTSVANHRRYDVSSLPIRSAGVVVAASVFVAASTVLVGAAVLRVPRSLAVLGLFALTLGANAFLVLWSLRNSGTIEINDDELIIKPRRGPTRRQTVREIASVQIIRRRVRVRYGFLIISYVRIVPNVGTVLQLVWDRGENSKRMDRAAELIRLLRLRFPELVVVETSGRPEKMHVLHGRRTNSTSNCGLAAFLAVGTCAFAGVMIHTLIPMSSGSALAAVQRLERSLADVPTGQPSSDAPVSVRSQSCFGTNGDSYWEEGVFNVEIREVLVSFDVPADVKTAVARIRAAAPKNWTVYASDALADTNGQVGVRLTTPCLRAGRGQFFPSLEARFARVGEKLRSRVDQALPE
jgi:hypothetical protein